MSFTEKALSFTFSGAQSGNFTAAGLRAAVTIQSFPGRQGSIGQVKVWGLTLAQMNAFSSKIPAGVAAEQFNLVIQAGDQGKKLSEVLNGPIYRSYIDLTSVPDSSFNVTMIDTFTGATPIAAQSQAGTQNAEDIISAVCAAANLKFDNSAGAHKTLSNPSTYGSALDQINALASAAGFNWLLNGKTVFIWPEGKSIDDVVIEVGPDTDPPMVGYPGYWEAGLIVASEYNAQVAIGRQMKVTSVIPKAQGKWSIIQVQHELTTMMPKAPWFTTAVLSLLGSS